MSTKTIALGTDVYRRLADAKQEGESFSRAIDRLLDELDRAHTGRDILGRLAAFEPLPERDAEAMEAVVTENRRQERWEPRDRRTVPDRTGN